MLQRPLSPRIPFAAPQAAFTETSTIAEAPRSDLIDDLKTALAAV